MNILSNDNSRCTEPVCIKFGTSYIHVIADLSSVRRTLHCFYQWNAR